MAPHQRSAEPAQLTSHNQEHGSAVFIWVRPTWSGPEVPEAFASIRAAAKQIISHACAIF
jgi:hypothetical protein